jgi:hypothetical protein
LDPEQISRELGIKPEHSFRAGQPRRSKSGLEIATVHTESYWLASLNPSSWFGNLPFEPLPNMPMSEDIIYPAIAQNLALSLGLCAGRFNKTHAAWLETIRSGGGEISLLVTISPTAINSFSVPPQVSRLFGEMGITLEFEMTP